MLRKGFIIRAADCHHMTDENSCHGKGSRPSIVTSDGGQRADEIFAALADRQRRCVLYCLQDKEQASVTDVATQIAAWEYDTSPDDIPDKAIKELKVTLFHQHLPKLREARLVEYDDRSQQLLLRDCPDLAEICLERCQEQDLPD